LYYFFYHAYNCQARESSVPLVISFSTPINCLFFRYFPLTALLSLLPELPVLLTQNNLFLSPQHIFYCLTGSNVISVVLRLSLERHPVKVSLPRNIYPIASRSGSSSPCLLSLFVCVVYVFWYLIDCLFCSFDPYSMGSSPTGYRTR
jgi:hypothetical protein